MADLPDSPETGDDTGVEPDRGPTTGTPRWVKVFGVVVIVLVLLLAVVLLFGGGPGGHGPGRHGGGGDRPTSEVTEDGGHRPPTGVDHGVERP